MGRGKLEGIIPFILLFLFLFYVHSKLYDLMSYLYGKLKRKYRKHFPTKPKQKAISEVTEK